MWYQKAYNNSKNKKNIFDIEFDLEVVHSGYDG
jgi:hypothetical protein